MTTVGLPQDITTTLNYYHPDSGHEHRPGTVGEKRRQYVPVKTTIRDMRGLTQDFTLNEHGFQLVEHESVEKAFVDDVRIKDVYLSECSELVKHITGATRVVPFGHIVRRQSFDVAKEAEKDLPDDARSSGPTTAGFVHIDNSYQGAYDRISGVIPDETATLTRCRWAIINLWRPIKPVTRNPLAMSDAASIHDSELEEVMILFPRANASKNDDKENQEPGADYYARDEKADSGLWQVHPPSQPDQHKWYYTSSMQPNEALLLKIFDSKKSGVARRSAHTSFSSALDHGPPRESLEVRMFVVWEDQTSE